MQQKNKRSNTLQTVLITAVIALAVGFFLGVGYSSYKMQDANITTGHPANQGTMHPPVDNQFQDRIDALRKEARENPGQADLWTQLGNLYFDHGGVTEAIDAYKKSLSINPDNANVLTDLGVMYRRNGEFQKAVETFTRANTIDPNHEVSLLNKGIVLLFDVQDTTGAVVAWVKLLSLNPSATTPSGQPLVDMVRSLKN